ncbi:MAG TPA: cupredoxin domain-containing protein [Vicinamibacterales bacterium]|nr:cupredoxin domain-containing protein [Vicinamibacterales bacterium]
MRRVILHVCLLIAAVTLTAAARPASPEQDKPHVVEIDAERFAFSPSEVRIKAGAPVEIRLRSDDTNHGFRILETEINVTIPKRGKGTMTVAFTPPKAGRYVFECSKVCGAGHAFMRGTLIAE